MHPPRRRGFFEASLGHRVDPDVLASALQLQRQRRRALGEGEGEAAEAAAAGAIEAAVDEGSVVGAPPTLRVAAFACDGRPCSEWALPYRFGQLLA